MTPAHAMVIASPAAVVDIVSQAAEDGQSDRIVVQLDPPELGRVSIDFKFDAQGLQHVTITSETPEAMLQLRMMHADLVQALERQGIAGQNMTFEHQQQNAQQAPLPNPFARSAALAGSSDDEANAAIAAADLRQTARTLPGGRLDIRL
jgi:flagellar hook-length control protein FliK